MIFIRACKDNASISKSQKGSDVRHLVSLTQSGDSFPSVFDFPTVKEPELCLPPESLVGVHEPRAQGPEKFPDLGISVGNDRDGLNTVSEEREEAEIVDPSSIWGSDWKQMGSSASMPGLPPICLMAVMPCTQMSSQAGGRLVTQEGTTRSRLKIMAFLLPGETRRGQAQSQSRYHIDW